MNSKKFLTFFIAALLIAACGNKNKAEDPLADSGRTQRTENLLSNLIAMGDSSVYLFGHHDDTVYGVGWQADYDSDTTVHVRSDVKSVCNDYPALLGLDLGRIETGDSVNQHGVPFSRIRQEAIAHYDRGGMVTLSWTFSGNPQADAVADFLNSLETPYGVKVPVLLRLRGTHQAKDWQTVVDCLRDHDVTNALYVYTPAGDPDGNESAYMQQYPGDDIIDILGIDSYCEAPEGDTTQIARYAAQMDKNLAMVCRLAKQHHKAAALTETGYEGIKTTDWWTRTLAPVLARHAVSYVLLWRNAHHEGSHFFVPYPGQQSASDFIRFYNDKQTLFLHDVNGLYF